LRFRSSLRQRWRLHVSADTVRPLGAPSAYGGVHDLRNLAAAALAVARTPLAAPHADGYTALWLVKDKRSAQLRVGVRSAELEATTYRLRIRLDGRALPTRWFRLRPGAAWEQTLPHGEWAAASLYRGGERATYRRVRLIDPSRAGRAPARGGS
jgi:hypothetical protein